jgi:hypothetical protein
LAENFPMLGFRRAAVPRRATLQTSDEVVIQITHVQVPSHPALHGTIDLNDLTWRHAGQDQGRAKVGDLTPHATRYLSFLLGRLGRFAACSGGNASL